MKAWLTPDVLPSGLRSCILQFPDNEEWASIVRGCLFLLSEERNFEEFGSLSVAQVADQFRQTLFLFLESDCVIVPTGAILPFAGDVEPTGFLWADGQPISRTDYADLFFVIGVTYGPGDGVTTFELPNLNGRVPVGVDGSQSEFNLLGETGGAKTHTLTAGQLPVVTVTQQAHNHTQSSHNHGQVSHDHGVPMRAGANTSTTVVARSGDGGLVNITTGNTTAVNVAQTAVNVAQTAVNNSFGSGQSHNNLQPYIAVNYIIKF